MKSSTTLSLLALALFGGSVWMWQQDSGEKATDVSSTTQGASDLRTKIRKKSPEILDQLSDPAISKKQRIAALRRLDPKTLSKDDIQKLYELIHFQPKPTNTADWHVVLNDLMFYVCQHNLNPESIVPTFTSLINDAGASEVARDYAIQTLGIWLRPGMGAGRSHVNSNPEEATRVFDTLMAVLTDPLNRNKSLPGTTLNVLGDFLPRSVKKKETEIVNPYPGTPLPPEALAAAKAAQPDNAAKDYSLAEKIEPWLASAIAGKNLASTPTRTTAIHVASKGRLSNLTPEIRKIALDEKSKDILRLAAISALGTLGEPTDREFLVSLAQTNGKFRFAAQTALKRLPES